MAMSLHNALISQDCEDSDEDDDDYVPTGEELSEDDIEDADLEETENPVTKSSKKQKKLKLEKNVKSRKRKGGISLSDDEQDTNEEQEEKVESPTAKSEEKVEDAEVEKKKVDSLWADFLSDVTPPPKKKTTSSSSSSPAELTSKSLISPTKLNPGPQKVTITKVFDFAGESVVVKEEVDPNSQAAKEFSKEQVKPASQSPNSSQVLKPPIGNKPNGLNAVLGKVLGKKAKLSTLEKSRLDWKNFKKEEGVEEVLDQYKKSKDGYLERQAFLERADLRQFEKEKEMRAVNRIHRV